MNYQEVNVSVIKGKKEVIYILSKINICSYPDFHITKAKGKAKEKV